jgi:6-phosphogluconolactonase
VSLQLRPFQEAAAYIAERIRQAVRKRGTCSLVLAGGDTPRGVYERLAGMQAAGALPWERVRLFWGDERFVPRDHPSSNYRMVREALLDRVGPPNVFPMPTQAVDERQAARQYERLLRGLFPGAAFPVFDLVLLGLGADGHTASLFPGGPECEERRRWCVASRAPLPPIQRLTLTLPVLNASRAVAFLVSGESKRPALRTLLDPAPSPAVADALPAQRVHVAGSGLLCFTDLRAR